MLALHTKVIDLVHVYILWAVVSAVAAFLTLGTHVFIVHTVFLYSLTVLFCFQHKLMMMMIYENLTCLTSTRLNSPGKTWKMVIEGPGGS